ncbi:MAG: NAD(P)/FAD-dependent oxidoreductase [Anaerolineae bacterium]|nr:NAD(P)/FAD-dependent oxidoreductase [Anaerolineae bacterium]
MRVIIIGNSATAVGAVESIRQYDQCAEILIFSEEPHGIYSRPLLDHFLAGEVDQKRVLYRTADFYTKHNVQPILGTRVTAIDPEAHTIAAETVDRAEAPKLYRYDKLLIATGGAPIVPRVPGVDMPGVYTFTRYDEVKRIHDDIAAGLVERAVVVGGGMIGLKATDALMKRGMRVTLLELAPRILSAAMDETGSRMLAELLTAAGVQVLTENTISEIGASDGARIAQVTLRDGQVIPCQMLVFGIGVRPNASLAEAAGLQVNRGIVVDEYMRASRAVQPGALLGSISTSELDIYAAGDVAEAYDLVVDLNRTVAIWPNAYRQGAIAGAHMVGVERPDAGGVAMNAVEVCGVTGMSIGNGNVDGNGFDVLVDLDEHRRHYKRLVIQSNHLVGAILIGNVSRAGIYTGLIRNRVDISGVRGALLSEHLGLLSLPDEYRKHLVTGAGIEV